jgi:hypothetical protein
MSLVRLLFCVGTAVLSESSQTFLSLQKKGPQEITLENKFLLYERLCMLSEACRQRTILRNESKGTIPPRTGFAFGQEIQANYNSKIS